MSGVNSQLQSQGQVKQSKQEKSKRMQQPLLGGFDGTSNVLAGKLFGIPVRGTHAHAFVTSFTGLEELSTRFSFFGDFPSDVLDHRELAMAEPAMENGEAPRKKVRRGDPQFNQLRTQKRQKENPEVKSSKSSAPLLFVAPPELLCSVFLEINCTLPQAS